MSNSFHDAHTETPRNVSISCPNSSNVSSMTKTGKSPRKSKALIGAESQNGINRFYESQNGHDHKIEVSNECLDLLGEVIWTGQLAPDKKKAKENVERAQVTAKLTTKEFVWADKSLKLVDIVSVSHVLHTRRFTLHSFPFGKSRWPCSKTRRRRKDDHFLAPSPDEAAEWVAAFQSQRCFVNYSPQPLPSSKRQRSKIDAKESPSDIATSCQPGRVMLVVLNPRSGRGCARKIYNSKVEPILKLAGLRLTVAETNGPHHAQNLAANADLSTCIDGIICVGGDGIVNEVLNGLLSREDTKQSRGIPIGIIPAGSDNSLIWTVMGIRDPASAAVAIVKGGLISTDIISVEWMKTGDVQMGHTIAYYGFMSDVLELSEKYQKRFGPLRYFVAGAWKFLCLPGYECEVEYLPAASQGHHEGIDSKGSHNEATLGNFDETIDTFDRKVDIEMGPRVLSNGFPNHESVLMTPCKLSSEHAILSGNIDANNEPSEYVRGLDTKSKRSLSLRAPIQAETEEVLTVNVTGPTTPSSRPRTRSKSRMERGWSGRTSGNGSSRGSYAMVDCPGDVLSLSGEEPSKSLGAKWAGQQEGCLDLKMNSEADGGGQVALKHGGLDDDQKWVAKQGPFLGVMICNHKCKTVQCLKSQMLAPAAEHDDRTLDLLMVHDVGRLQLLRFLVLMQFGRHLSLPFVEHMKVQSVKLKPGSKSHKGCGIDGELVSLNGPLTITLLNEQCQLIGHSVNSS